MVGELAQFRYRLLRFTGKAGVTRQQHQLMLERLAGEPFGGGAALAHGAERAAYAAGEKRNRQKGRHAHFASAWEPFPKGEVFDCGAAREHGRSCAP